MEIVTIPCLYDNYSYLIIDRDRSVASVVDPSEAWPVMRELEHRGLSLEGALCTHHHHDHIGGVDDLLGEYPDLRVLGFRDDHHRIPQLTELLDDTSTFSLGSATVEVIHTPGHTSGGIVFKLGSSLFVGDTLFGAGCGRLFEGTPEQMHNSLSRIVSCGADSEIFFGHEYTALNLRFAAQIEPDNPAIRQRTVQVQKLREDDRPSTPSTLAEEFQTNPFLRSTEPSVIDHLSQKKGLARNDSVAVFAALREMRNNFS